MTDKIAPEEVERVAKGLTKAQREAVMHRSGAHEVVASPAMDPLWFCINKIGGGQFGIALTSLGLAVRSYLTAKPATIAGRTGE